jgi:hypothetical protein
VCLKDPIVMPISASHSFSMVAAHSAERATRGCFVHPLLAVVDLGSALAGATRLRYTARARIESKPPNTKHEHGDSTSCILDFLFAEAARVVPLHHLANNQHH